MPAPPLPVEALRSHVTDLRARMAVLESDSASESRARPLAERDELADREWLAGVEGEVMAEIGRRQAIARLERAVRDTQTGRITHKSTEIADTLVTGALRAAFAREVEHLGLTRLEIELRKDRGAQGVPWFRVTLVNRPSAKVGEVLSEGEHRCVALAAFLAEQATALTRSAIVFDDPSSSLDHLHRERVAMRLADEGQRRQVIVFTHDLPFLFLLEAECREQGTPVTCRAVTRSIDGVGHCKTDVPLKAQPVERLLDALRTHVKNRAFHFERGDETEWAKTVSVVADQVRKGWERAVEEVLSPVLKRFSNKVDTSRLMAITPLTPDDCVVVRDAFGRCSALLHSSSNHVNSPLPEPQELVREIDALEASMTDIRARQRRALDQL